MTTNTLGVIALVLSVGVGLSETLYYFAHPYRHGVAPHLIALSLAVALLAVVIGLQSKSK